MKEYLHTIFRSICVVALLCGSMSAWADDVLTETPEFTTDLEDAYSVITNRTLTLTVEASSATSYQWYTCEDEYGTNPSEIDDATSASYSYTPETEDAVYIYCVATNENADEGSQTATSTITCVTPNSEWSDVFDQAGTKDSPCLITNSNWDDFISGMDNNYTIDGLYFKLKEDITATSAPSSQMCFDEGYFDFNSKTISYTTSCPSSSHDALFFSNDDPDYVDDNNVSYTYTISDETEWGNFSGFSTFPTNVKFQLTDNIETSTTPSLLTGVTSSNFNCDGHTITFTGLTSLPPDSKSSAEGYQVFNDETLQGSVYYNYNVGGDGITGDDFVTFASSTYLGDNDSFKLIGDAFVNTAPTTSLSSITSTNFDNSENHYVYICNSSSTPSNSTYNDYIALPGSPCQLFANEDLDKSVSKYYYLLDSDDELKTFVTTKFLQKKNVTICIKCGTTSDGDTKYDVSSVSFTYPLEEECNVCTLNGSNGIYKVEITLPTTDDPLAEGFTGKSLFTKTTNNNNINKYSYKQVGGDVDALANALLDSFYQGVLTDESKRGGKFSELVSEITDLAGHGTEEKPYLIATYDMLKVLVGYVNTNSTETSGMYIKLISDINAQGGERLTGVNGEELIASPVENVQFSVPFKGKFDGNHFSLGGFTKPLFSSLDGATVENLGIVDCYMRTNTPALVSNDVTSSTIKKCYVSGVSNGLAPSDVTLTNCYAYNTKEKTETYSSDFSKTTKDASDTHYILSDNCYTLVDKKSDCTLFIPTDNTFYTYTNSNTDLTALTNKYYSIGTGGYVSDDFIKWSEMGLTDHCVDNPAKSNVSLLYNVIQSDGCKVEGGKAEGYFGDNTALSNLYYWYLVDKQNLTLPNVTATALRIKNIYYSRNAKDGTAAPKGLNTVYLPFAWNYSTDVVDNSGNAISGTSVYILADKINASNEFDNTASYVDYTKESSLKFFVPSAEGFEICSCALPTILDVPQNGWAIKKHADTGWFYYSNSFDGSKLSKVNMLAKFEGPSAKDGSPLHDGRSFMDINRLKLTADIDNDKVVDLSSDGRAIHCGTFTTVAARTFGSGTLSDIQDKTLTCYKLNSAGKGFASVTTSSSVQPFRTFIAIAPSESGGSAKQSFGFGITGISDTEDTAIDGVHVDNIELLTPEQSRVYSLDGRYVGQYGKKLAPGMYIMNGKKFVVK